HGDSGYAEPYLLALASGGVDGSGDETDLTDVEAVFDLSSLAGKVGVQLTSGGPSCTEDQGVVRCPLGDFYQRTELSPFKLTALEGTSVGVAGTIGLTVTASNAATVTRTTQVVVGSPRLTTDPVTSQELTGGSVQVSPAFGNRGDIAVTQGITLQVSSAAGTTARYSNCRYNRADAPTVAECTFDRALAPGDAFRTDGAFSFAPPDASSGVTVTYAVWPTGNPPDLAGALPADAPRGTGGPLGLTAIDGSALVAGGSTELTFLPPGGTHVDLAATAFTITGKIGRTVDVNVPYPTTPKGGFDRSMVEGPLEVTMPPGTTALPLGRDEETEAVYCVPADGGTKATCGFGPDGFGTVLRVRIDRKVAGATGTITVRPKGDIDPNPANNSAAITVAVQGGSPSGSPSATPTSGSSPDSPAGNQPSPIATAPAAGDGNGDRLAATGTSGAPLLGVGGAAFLLGGVLLVVRHRRRRTV
ncbi:LPXTG cell wall anchor domain-containing protein, partial [Actinacidiphila bryophytorum]